jgi:hypothetical protein
VAPVVAAEEASTCDVGSSGDETGTCEASSQGVTATAGVEGVDMVTAGATAAAESAKVTVGTAATAAAAAAVAAVDGVDELTHAASQAHPVPEAGQLVTHIRPRLSVLIVGSPPTFPQNNLPSDIGFRFVKPSSKLAALVGFRISGLGDRGRVYNLGFKFWG